MCDECAKGYDLSEEDETCKGGYLDLLKQSRD